MGDREIAQNIRAIREDAGMSQQEVADEMGLDRTAYGRRESGKRSFRAEEIARFSAIAGCNIADIFR